MWLKSQNVFVKHDIFLNKHDFIRIANSRSALKITFMFMLSEEVKMWEQLEYFNKNCILNLF